MGGCNLKKYSVIKKYLDIATLFLFRYTLVPSVLLTYFALSQQAEEGLSVRLRMEAVRLPCAGQSLRARDGDSLGSPLLASWDGPDSSAVV